MTEAQRVKEGRIRDSLRWVAQEASKAVAAPITLPPGCKLREALESLDNAYESSED